MKRVISLLSLLCIGSRIVFAQAELANANSGVSKNSAQNTLTGGGIVAPDLFSGAANVNIPIYSYSIDGLELGVSLSYNTLGIKVDQVASDVGLGWNLNSGGIITREVHGVEDELTEQGIDTLDITTTPHAYINCVPKQQGQWSDNGVLSGGGGGEAEHAPDVFTASFGGRTLNFSLANYHYSSTADETSNLGGMLTLYTSPKKNIRVDIFIGSKNLYSILANDKVPENAALAGADGILKFKITDEHGNQFFFDRGVYQNRTFDYKTFHHTDNQGVNVYQVTQNWVLKKVITYTGSVISYYYDLDIYSYPAYRNQMVQESYSFPNPDVSGTIYPGRIDAINDVINNSYGANRLTKIEFPNGDVVSFIRGTAGRVDIMGGGGTSTNCRALELVKVQSSYDGTVSNSLAYKFNYAYFNAGIEGPELPYPAGGSSNPYYNTRLKLLGIDKIGSDGTTSEPYYKFGYSDVNLPPRLSGLTDCYGYFNGKPTLPGHIVPISSEYTTVLGQLDNINIPLHSFTFEDHTGSTINCTYGRDLTPDWTKAQAGLLKSVTNGLGGSIQLIYKDHNLTNPPDFFSSPSSLINTGYFDISDVGCSNPGSSLADIYHAPLYMPYPDANDGVCIQQIDYKDGFNNDNSQTQFFDFEDEIGSPAGYRFFPGNYFWYPFFLSSRIDNNTDDISLQPYGVIQTNSFVSAPDLISGANHGYTHARVRTVGYSGALLGSKVYTFTNLIPHDVDNEEEKVNGVPATICRTKVRYGLYNHCAPRLRFEKQYMGLLKKVEEYDNLGNLMSRSRNCYNKVNKDSISATTSQAFNSWHYGPTAEITNYITIDGSHVLLTQSLIESFSGGESMAVKKFYAYDADGDLIESSWYNSKHQLIKEQNYYTGTGFDEVYETYLSVPFKNTHLKYLTQKRKLVDGQIFDYAALFSGDLSSYSTKMYNDVGAEVDLSYIGGIKVTSNLSSLHFDQVRSLHSTDVVTYTTDNDILAKHYIQYDNHNNVLTTGYNNDQKFGSSIWDTRIGKKVADISNAKYTDVAYSSFEGQFLGAGVPDYNKGNWNFAPDHVVLAPSSAPAITGRYYLDLSGTALSSFILPQVGKRYQLSFWYRGTMPSVHISTAVIPMEDIITVGGWTLASGTLTGTGSATVDISGGAGCAIDELRLLPADASMNTSTYEPLFGVSSQCNERNDITYIEYDVMGRPTITRDINRNIISLSKHTVAGSDY